MSILIKLLFVLLLFLYLYFFAKLIRKNFSFSLGILFGVLFFVFIPLSVFLSTHVLEVSRMDFSSADLLDVIMEEMLMESFMLIAYLFSILTFIYFAEFSRFRELRKSRPFPLNWKSYFLISLLIGGFIFIAAGIHEGGNWYVSREHFYKNGGSLALALTDSYTAFKIIFIASLVAMYKKRKIHLFNFFLVALMFSVIDVLLTGNRVFVFVLFATITIEFIYLYKFKVILFGLLVIPFGYLMSIYRHVRGGLFVDGIPSFHKISFLISQAMEKDPPSIKGFLLGISESVDFNVIYSIFDYITFDNALWGETFLKSFTYLIPRSVWADKPLSITQQAAEWFSPQSEHLSLVTTIIGEAHANFYVYGIIILPIILFVTDRLLKKMFLNSVFANIILFMIGLLIFRMPYSDILLVAIFVFVFYQVILIKKYKKFV